MLAHALGKTLGEGTVLPNATKPSKLSPLTLPHALAHITQAVKAAFSKLHVFCAASRQPKQCIGATFRHMKHLLFIFSLTISRYNTSLQLTRTVPGSICDIKFKR